MKYEPLWNADRQDGTYSNPILYTDYSDPDVIRNGNDFYMVASSFSNSPAIPVLHSKDLVNWKLINYVLDRLPFDRYNVPQHGRGVWAPSIRFHEGLYYVYFPMPDEGIFMCTTDDPAGKWSDPVCVKEVKGWIDPCPFWDDDGNAYLAFAQSQGIMGKSSVINMVSMSREGKKVTGDVREVFDGTFNHPVIEGPKVYKRNGYYYIFCPAGTVKTGWQTVLRSENIYGPYESRIVMMQCETPINGPHQGGWVTTQTGQDWFIHFQYVLNAGRITHLEPMDWENDWPVIGRNKGTGYGKPVMSWEKPNVLREFPVCSPDDSDFFDTEKLGLQWQWNANYCDDWFSIDSKNKQLCLNSKPYDGSLLYNIPNILLQKWNAPKFQTVSEFELDELKEGDLAGIISFGRHYISLAVECFKEGKRLVYISGNSKTQVKLPVSDIIDMKKVRIKMTNVVKTGLTTFSYSVDDGEPVALSKLDYAYEGVWVGVKNGLFAINNNGRAGGVLKVNYFILQK